MPGDLFKKLLKSVTYYLNGPLKKKIFPVFEWLGLDIGGGAEERLNKKSVYQVMVFKFLYPGYQRFGQA
jgi:hypothetical protein